MNGHVVSAGQVFCEGFFSCVLRLVRSCLLLACGMNAVFAPFASSLTLFVTATSSAHQGMVTSEDQ